MTIGCWFKSLLNWEEAIWASATCGALYLISAKELGVSVDALTMALTKLQNCKIWRQPDLSGHLEQLNR
jgi:hypothetical protein